MHDVLVVDPLSHFLQQPVMPDIVKVGPQIKVEDPRLPLSYCFRHSLESYCGMLVTVGGQAASDCWLTVSMPSMNFTPVISFGNWLWPSRRRQLFSAACASLKTMAIAVLFERHPLERTVRCRTVANVLSMGLVVRRCFQCSAGKS